MTQPKVLWVGERGKDRFRVVGTAETVEVEIVGLDAMGESRWTVLPSSGPVGLVRDQVLIAAILHLARVKETGS